MNREIACGPPLRLVARSCFWVMPVPKVTLDEIVGLARYEEMRDQVRRRIIALKRHRRVPVGDRVTFVFENHETVWFQIQEMLRAEHIADIDRVREEVEVYNELIPAPGELSSTMFIEITEPEKIREELTRFLGVEECVCLELGSERIHARFEPGRSREDRISAVQYVRFCFPHGASGIFQDLSVPVRLVIDHPYYRHAVELPSEVRQSLAEDLR